MARQKTVHILVVLATHSFKYDGRVKNEIRTLKAACPTVRIDVVVLENTVTSDPEVEVDHFESISLKTRGLSKRPVEQAIKLIEFVVRFIRQAHIAQPDAIYAHNEVGGLCALVASKLLSIPFIYDDHELGVRGDSWLHGLAGWMETLFMKRATRVVEASRERTEWVRKEYGVEKNKLVTVENLVGRANSWDRFVERHGEVADAIVGMERPYLLHQGRLYGRRRPDLLADVVDILPSDWEVWFIGTDSSEVEAWKESLDCPLPSRRIRNFGFIDYNCLPWVWKYASASAVFYDCSTVNNRLCAPNRLYLGLATETPLVVNRENVVLCRGVVSESNGYCVTRATVDKIAWDEIAVREYGRNVSPIESARYLFEIGNRWQVWELYEAVRAKMNARCVR